ncbi:MAG TPA: Holliday junction resolvase RuvX [Candidatus Bipolaricaulota bacterium]
MEAGKVLALDWGAVRWGWALSDPTHTLAGRSGVYLCQDPGADLVFLKQLIQAEGVGEIVLGLPQNMDGSLGPQAQALLQFKREIEQALAIPCATFDERLTTAEAERVMLEGGLSRARRKEKRDALAATIILQSYLDAKRNKRGPR